MANKNLPYSGFGTKETNQQQPIPGRKDQVPNSEGGYVWEVDKWDQMMRFLILGSEEGTYYIGQQELTKQNAEATLACINEDGERAVDLIVDVSDSGRATKNDLALFALAMAAGEGDEKTRQYALANLSKVARIFTHLSHFLSYVQEFRGWGRSLRRAVADWYNEKDPNYLAYQMVKYRQRDGWTHMDAIRLSHPKPVSRAHDLAFGYAVGKIDWPDIAFGKYGSLDIIDGYERAKEEESVSGIVSLVETYGLTREMIPTNFLKEKDVWRALFNDGEMPTWALLRNLGNMTDVGLIGEGKFDINQKAIDALTDEERLNKSRMHPLSVLVALKTYESGGEFGRGSKTWSPATSIVNALDDAFYKCFDNVEPTGKRLLLGVDVSGSMFGSLFRDPGATLSPAEKAGAMALITAATESEVVIKGFSNDFVDLNISPRQRLDDVLKIMDDMPFGRTNCALPMIWAMENEVIVDAFIVYTDSETNYGRIHPAQALQEYRRKFNPEARLAVVAIEPNKFSIADPKDSGMMDFVGFDTSAPAIINNFIRGDL